MNNAIEVNNLTKQYQDFKLDHVSFKLPAGSIMGFIGENGAGKSTTIKLILDLIKKDEGSIKVMGKELDCSKTSMKEQIGVVMDESCFPDNLNLKEISKIMKNCYKTWDDHEFMNYQQKFRLPIAKPVKDYSRGMKMKLSIAVALSHDSKLLILDEATSGLDPIVRDEILDVFLDFIQKEDHSILISSHIISDLEKICDYITFIHQGKIIFSEDKDTLLTKYAIVKCAKNEIDSIGKDAVIAYRKNAFGAEVLVDKKKVKGNFVMDRAGIEDIMLYFVKEERA